MTVDEMFTLEMQPEFQPDRFCTKNGFCDNNDRNENRRGEL